MSPVQTSFMELKLVSLQRLIVSRLYLFDYSVERHWRRQKERQSFEYSTTRIQPFQICFLSSLWKCKHCTKNSIRSIRRRTWPSSSQTSLFRLIDCMLCYHYIHSYDFEAQVCHAHRAFLFNVSGLCSYWTSRIRTCLPLSGYWFSQGICLIKIGGDSLIFNKTPIAMWNLSNYFQ
jgi:hypothetical protein